MLSKSDLLEDPNQLNEVAQFVSVNFKTLLGIDPVIFPVSSKLALRAKTDIKGMMQTLQMHREREKLILSENELCLRKEDISKLKSKMTAYKN